MVKSKKEAASSSTEEVALKIDRFEFKFRFGSQFSYLYNYDSNYRDICY